MEDDSARRWAIADVFPVWEVTDRTVREWIATGKVTCFEQDPETQEWSATRGAVWAEPVFRPSAVRAKLGPVAVGVALQTGIVEPGARWSLDQIEQARVAATEPEQERSYPIESLSDTAEGREKLYRLYAFEGLAPADFPQWFWQLPECPKFIPPKGVFRYWLEGPPIDKDGRVIRWIGRSEGWMPVSDSTEWVLVEEDAHAEYVSGGSLPEGYPEFSLYYEVTRQVWLAEYEKRGPQRANSRRNAD
jgi:hypothetical protein